MAKKSKKSPRKSGSSDSGSNMNNDDIVDERFIAAATRPQFQKAKRGGKIDDISRNSTTSTNDKNNTSASLASSGLGVSLTQAIASDDRFAAALNSEKFGSVPSRDKYGRKTKKKSKKDSDDTIQENSDSSDSDEDSSVEDTTSTKYKKKKNSAHHVNNKDSDSDIEEEQDNSMEARIAYLNALSRGDISTSSSSSSEDEDDSDDNSDSDDDDSSTSSTNIHGKSGILNPTHKSKYDSNSEDEEVELTHEPSNHLCILNLNWEHVRAMDVYAMLHSFCPPGTLKNVQVFPSDFGNERMAKERIEGPGFAGLWKRDKKGRSVEHVDESGDDSSDNDDDESVDDNSGEESSEGSIKDGEEEQHSDDESDIASDDEEDVFNLAEATSKLYSHFPDQSTVMKNSQLQTQDEEEEGFDIEALREYEASKLRYYFAIATFTTSQAAEVVYENVDGMEMENSAAEIDVRVLPSDQYDATIEGRTIRDSCNQLPAKYVPPENVVATALQQSRVTCSWERGDADRERKLTKYGMGKDAWEALAEGDDIKFYLATSDNSSESEESDSDDEKQVDDNVNANKKDASKKKKKGSSMRAMLGLAGSDDDSNASEDDDNEEERRRLMGEQSISEDSSSGSDDDSKSEAELEGEINTDTAKSVTYIPGKHNLEQKIRSKLQSKQTLADGEVQANTDDEPLTPFQKYLEKKKEKRRERRQAARGARKGKNFNNKDSSDDELNEQNEAEDDGMYDVDPEFGIAKFSDEENDETAVTSSTGGDGFFLNETDSSNNNQKNDKFNKKQKKKLDSKIVDENKLASTKEELELLIAGDDGEYWYLCSDRKSCYFSVIRISQLSHSYLPLYSSDEEHKKDYDMRGLTKLERHGKKKLKGKRKHQLETLAANVSGQDFQVDTTDTRFAALLDGTDDRFGIDRTNPAYKETGAMKELLQEQSKRRRKKSKVKSNTSSKDEDVARRGDSWKESSNGAMALSSLVQSLQQKVKK